MTKETSAFVVVLPVVFLCLLAGALFRFIILRIHHKYRPPFSVLLFTFGFIISAITHYFLYGYLGTGISIIQNIDPQIILLLLLPPLLFESSSKTDWFTFKRVAGQSILLAFPGQFIAAILTAAFVFYAFDYGWSWYAAFACASILSATDPVSVVAALDVLGAPLRLSVLAFLNDGSAAVIFILFTQALAGDFKFADQITLELVQLTVGGPIVGIVSGYILHRCLKPIFHDPLLESCVIFTSIFLVFYLAEQIFKVSAVLAIICFGIFFSWKGNSMLDIESHAHHLTVLSQIAYLCNTLIFIIAGSVIFEIFTGSSFGDDRELNSTAISFASDYKYWMHSLFLYVALTVIRAVSVLSLYPILQKMGYGFDLKTFCILVWSGLRGAVSLTLALLILVDDRIDRNVRYEIAFHVSGIVLLTTIINGSTIEWVYGKLNIDMPDTHASDLAVSVMKHVQKYKIDPTIKRMQSNWFYHNGSWETVFALVPDLSKITISHGRVNGEDLFTECMTKTPSMMKIDLSASPDRTIPMANRNFRRYEDPVFMSQSSHNDIHLTMRGDDVGALTDAQMEEQIRRLFFAAAKSNYSRQFELGYICVDTRELLMEAADVGMGSGPSSFRHCKHFPADILSNAKINHHWDTLKSYLEPKASKIKRLIPQQLKNSMLSNHLMLIVSTLSAFVHANNQVLVNLSAVFDSTYIAPLLDEVNLVNSKALEMLEDVQKKYPKRLIQVKTIKAAEYLIRLKRELVRIKHEEGMIDASIAEQVNELLEKVLKRIIDDPFGVVEREAKRRIESLQEDPIMGMEMGVGQDGGSTRKG